MIAETCAGPDDCPGTDECVVCQTDLCATHPGPGVTPCPAGGLHCSRECEIGCMAGNRARLAGVDRVDDFTTTVDAAERFERECAEDHLDAEDYYRARYA